MFIFLLKITYPKFTKIGDKKVLQALLGYANLTQYTINANCLVLMDPTFNYPFLKDFFLPYPEFCLRYDTEILQHIRIIELDAGFEPGTSAPEVWCATRPHYCVVCFPIQIFALVCCTVLIVSPFI